MTRHYVEMTLLIERLHRRYLDVVRAELSRLGIRDINAAQALVLANVGDGEVLVRDLVDRGYYLGPNMFYSIRKLVDYGYLQQSRDEHDRRACRVSLTDKAKALVPRIHELDRRHAEILGEHDISTEELEGLCVTLRRVERAWSDILHFGPTMRSLAPTRLITDDLWEARTGKRKNAEEDEGEDAAYAQLLNDL